MGAGFGMPFVLVCFALRHVWLVFFGALRLWLASRLCWFCSLPRLVGFFGGWRLGFVCFALCHRLVVLLGGFTASA